jgi:hypothetical protein
MASGDQPVTSITDRRHEMQKQPGTSESLTAAFALVVVKSVL